MQANQFLFESLCIRAPSQHVAVFTVTPGSLPAGVSAAIYLQFAEDPAREWRFMGVIGEGKESAFFKVVVPSSIAMDGRSLLASLGISILPTNQIPQETSLVLSSSPAINNNSTVSESLLVAKKLLENFVNYALSFATTFSSGNVAVSSAEEGVTYIPAKIVTEWYNGTLRKAQMDPIGFVKRLLKDE